TLNPESFKGLDRVNYLSLADNNLEEIPYNLWKEMPNIGTLDLGRTKIKNISDNSFSGLPNLKCLVLPGNQISHVDSNSIPKQIQRVHLGRNNIKDLNDSLKNLPQLGWLFINSNSLTNLDGQLPRSAPNLKMIHASNNNLEKLPAQLRNYPLLDSVFFEKNRLKALDGAVSKCDRLMRLALDYNEISTLTEDDFEGATSLTSLLLGHNEITTLNNSLIHLRNLNFLNLTFNQFVEFSLQEVAELKQLRIIDLSYNKITTLMGPTPNMVEWNIKLTEIKLDHNLIERLNGAFSGLSELLRLNLSFNKLKKISPEDLIGLEQLRLLDVSHNQLTSLEETSQTYLPRLSELKASYNYLKILEKDFHGLPVLCHADLSNNQIVALGKDLVAKTRCTIEHGVHEGTWDTLKIYLQDNPILCDAALPDTMLIMEINHTRIYGVSHCPPLSEQPTTSKPNGFFGIIPATTPSLPAAISANQENPFQSEQSNHKNSPSAEQSEVPLGQKVQNAGDNREAHQLSANEDSTQRNKTLEDATNEYLQQNSTMNDTNNQQNMMSIVEINQGVTHCPSLSEQPTTSKPNGFTGYIPETTPSLPAAISANHDATNEYLQQNSTMNNTTNQQKAQNLDPVQQGQQINKLATEIERLRSRIDQLSSQKKLLLNKKFNSSIADLTEQKKQ
ncbi:Protein artichoke, partial [Gonioctena quinquepunctata]